MTTPLSPDRTKNSFLQANIEIRTEPASLCLETRSYALSHAK